MKIALSKKYLIIFSGILFIILYGVLYFSSYEINYPYLFKTFWPIILIIIGILQTLNSRFKDLTSATLLMIIGIMILFMNLQFLSLESFWEKWPNPLRDFLFLLTSNASNILFSI